MKRDLSLVQALFTGQFKSMMTCSCGHTSARFEPFNILAVPIPEDFMRMLTVHVVFDQSPFALIITLRVDRRSDLHSVVDVINKLNIPSSIRTGAASEHGKQGSTVDEAKSMFVAVEITNSMIDSMFSLERKIDMIRDENNIFLYETRRPHRGGVTGARSMKLPPPHDPTFDHVGGASSNSEEIPNNISAVTNTMTQPGASVLSDYLDGSSPSGESHPEETNKSLGVISCHCMYALASRLYLLVYVL